MTWREALAKPPGGRARQVALNRLSRGRHSFTLVCIFLGGRRVSVLAWCLMQCSASAGAQSEIAESRRWAGRCSSQDGLCARQSAKRQASGLFEMTVRFKHTYDFETRTVTKSASSTFQQSLGVSHCLSRAVYTVQSIAHPHSRRLPHIAIDILGPCPSYLLHSHTRHYYDRLNTHKLPICPPERWPGFSNESFSEQFSPSRRPICILGLIESPNQTPHARHGRGARFSSIS